MSGPSKVYGKYAMDAAGTAATARKKSKSNDIEDFLDESKKRSKLYPLPERVRNAKNHSVPVPSWVVIPTPPVVASKQTERLVTPPTDADLLAINQRLQAAFDQLARR